DVKDLLTTVIAATFNRLPIPCCILSFRIILSCSILSLCILSYPMSCILSHPKSCILSLCILIHLITLMPLFPKSDFLVYSNSLHKCCFLFTLVTVHMFNVSTFSTLTTLSRNQHLSATLLTQEFA